jgi:hypothetical protein
MLILLSTSAVSFSETATRYNNPVSYSNLFTKTGGQVNYIDFVKERKKLPKINKKEKCPPFPSNHMVVNGETILASFSGLEIIGPVVKSVIQKVLGSKKNVPNLYLSWVNYHFVKSVYEGYLSEKDQIILCFNHLIHDASLPVYINAQASYPVKTKKILRYFEFFSYIQGINNFIEFGEALNIDHYLDCSKSFFFDSKLKSFCFLMNVLLKQHKNLASRSSNIKMNEELSTILATQLKSA